MRNLHISCGHGDPLQGKLLLKKVLRGILRYQGQTRILRQPVTPHVLLAIRPILQGWLGTNDFAMVWAAFTLAFFGFLRCSEFTYQGVNRFRSQFELSTDAISFTPVWPPRNICVLPLRPLRQIAFGRVTLLLSPVLQLRYAPLLLCKNTF